MHFSWKWILGIDIHIKQLISFSTVCTRTNITARLLNEEIYQPLSHHRGSAADSLTFQWVPMEDSQITGPVSLGPGWPFCHLPKGEVVEARWGWWMRLSIWHDTAQQFHWVSQSHNYLPIHFQVPLWLALLLLLRSTRRAVGLHWRSCTVGMCPQHCAVSTKVKKQKQSVLAHPGCRWQSLVTDTFRWCSHWEA